MRPPYATDAALRKFVTDALQEDVGTGDHSTLACIPADLSSRAELKIKSEGILAGVELAQFIFAQVDPGLKVDVKLEDGAPISPGMVAFRVEGNARAILTTERLVLNCMQRMSGIATLTHRLTTLLAGTSAHLLDTRKTTPLFRVFEKWAVLIGGGTNHRMGLFDLIMLKDNHIDTAGGIERAIIRTKDYLRARNLSLRIEVEARSLADVEEILRVGGVDIIMLDNMSAEQMAQAVKLVAGRAKTEASGGITAANLREAALSGVDFVSVGALTHGATSLDLSLKAC